MPENHLDFQLVDSVLFPDSREDLEEISERKPDLESLEGNSEVRSDHLGNVMLITTIQL